MKLDWSTVLGMCLFDLRTVVAPRTVGSGEEAFTRIPRTPLDADPGTVSKLLESVRLKTLSAPPNRHFYTERAGLRTLKFGPLDFDASVSSLNPLCLRRLIHRVNSTLFDHSKR